MAKILVSVPVLGRPNLRMMQSLYSAINSCKEHDITIYTSENDSMISRVRNVHISTYIHDYKEYDYFISIDSDLEIVNKFESNNIFSKLVAHDVKFVGGLYALKKEGEVVCASVPMDRNRSPEFNGDLTSMLWLSSGCWCLRRDAIEKMIESFPELTYDGDDNMSNKKIFGLYIPMLQTIHLDKGDITKYLSEDWSFCQRWRDIGGQIFADTSIVLKHYGEKAYSLWDVEVVVRKKTEEEKEPKRNNPHVISRGHCDYEADALAANHPPQAGFDLGEQ
jgi:hypothetical protein